MVEDVTVKSGTVVPLLYVGDQPFETDCPLVRAYVAIRLVFETRVEDEKTESESEKKK